MRQSVKALLITIGLITAVLIVCVGALHAPPWVGTTLGITALVGLVYAFVYGALEE